MRFMASAVLWKYKPKIVGITGSVGKTSCKEAVFAVLHERFEVRKNEKNYNNEIGLPLTIIGAESGERSFWKWLAVFFKWLGVMIFPVRYPEILILEMGADRPGDISYLTDFIKPKIGIITDISGSHLEFFKTVEGVAKEKGTLVKSLNRRGMAILNADNSYSAKMKNQVRCQAMMFGFSEEADIRSTGEDFNFDEETHKVKGLSFKLNYKGTSLPVRLNNVLARHQIYAALAAAAVGAEFAINLVEISQALEKFSSPAGRMNLFSGIKNSSIVDDTYNSSPASAKAALAVLAVIPASRKIAVLGDMLELGTESENLHRNLAKEITASGTQIIFAVGKRMQFAVQALERMNFPAENIYTFNNSIEASKKLQEIIQEGDLILVKGSQGMRMEKIVEEVMANPEEAEKLLCRQSQKWKETPVGEV